MTAYEVRISDWSSDVCSSDLIALSALQEMIEQIRPYETGYVSIVANGGTYSASIDAGLLGKPMGEADGLVGAAGIAEAVKNGEQHTAVTSGPAGRLINVFSPLNVGKSVPPWSMVVTIPEDKALAAATSLSNLAILIGPHRKSVL